MAGPSLFVSAVNIVQIISIFFSTKLFLPIQPAKSTNSEVHKKNLIRLKFKFRVCSTKASKSSSNEI